MAKLNPRTGISSQSRSRGAGRTVPARNRDVRAANQNFRKTPANNNYRRGESVFKDLGKQAKQLPGAAKAARKLIRRIPRIGNLVDLYDLLNRYGNEEYPFIEGFNNPGWTPGAVCPGFSPDYISFNTSTNGFPSPLLCGADLVPSAITPPSVGPDMNVMPPANARRAEFWEYAGCVGSPGTGWDACAAISRRYNRAFIYTFPANARPWRQYRAAKTPRFIKDPRQDPIHLPINQPVPLLRPLPQKQANAAEKRNARHYTRKAQRPLVPNPLAWGDPLVTGGLFPFPGARLEVAPTVRILPGVHRNARPPRRTKERKFILTPSPGSPVGLLINGITETSDFVQSLYYAIPPRYRKLPPGETKTGLHEKMWAIYQHYDKINMSYALNNLLQNQIEDAIGGAIGKAMGRSHRRFWEQTGYNSPFHGYNRLPSL